MTTTITTTTFKKLRDGSWGIQGHGLIAGHTVTVTKKSGETTTGTVGRVLFTAADGYSIATFAATAPRRSLRRDGQGCHTDGNCSSLCNPRTCPCGDGGWFRCC